MSVWLWLCGLAWAGLDEDDLNRMVAELAPQMRLATGATLSPLPVTRLVSVAEAQLDDEEKGLLGYYEAEGNRITMLHDNVSAMVKSLSVPSAQAEAVVRCVMAHELVHAVQAERMPRPPRSEGEVALVEGQATFIAEGLCPAEVRHLTRAALGVDVLSTRDPEDQTTWAYGYGYAFVRAYEARFGVGSTWKLLARLTGSAPPAFSHEDVALVASETLPYGWWAWDVPETVGRALLGVPSEWTRQPISPYALVAPPNQYRAEAGLLVRGVGDLAEVRLYVWHMDDVQMPRRWVAERRNGLTSDAVRVLTSLPASRWTSRKERVLRGLDENDGVMAVEMRHTTGDTAMRYRETWVANGHLLIGVAEDSSARGSDVVAAINALLTGPAAARPPSGSDAIFARLAPE